MVTATRVGALAGQCECRDDGGNNCEFSIHPWSPGRPFWTEARYVGCFAA
jgi:hypothetical protein